MGEKLLEQVAVLLHCLFGSSCMQGCEQEKDTWYCAVSQAEPCFNAVQEEGELESSPELTGASNS